MSETERVRVNAKWGFGTAPEKPSTRSRRINAIREIEPLIDPVKPSVETISAYQHAQPHVSEIKGLFTRSWKQDQWDWFTVWCQLGRLPLRVLRNTSSELQNLNLAAKRADIGQLQLVTRRLNSLKIHRALRSYRLQTQQFLGGAIYILSTREQPRLLKVGCTERNPLQRVREINSATGVLIPFGVRGAWQVENPKEAERRIHELLREWRVRPDREFFELEFQEAARLITNELRLA